MKPHIVRSTHTITLLGKEKEGKDKAKAKFQNTGAGMWISREWNNGKGIKDVSYW